MLPVHACRVFIAGYMRLLREAEPQCSTDPEPQDGYVCETDNTGPITVCGQCGILGQSSYPVGVRVLGNYSFVPDAPSTESKKHHKSQGEDNTVALTAGLATMFVIAVVLAAILVYIMRSYHLQPKTGKAVFRSGSGDYYRSMSLDEGFIAPMRSLSNT